jgi:APA family basic amino acid/polyamine antiporter
MDTTDSPPAHRPRLLRALGPLMATAVVVGTVIGSGVFKKPQEVATHLPFSGLAALVWVLGGLLALFGALTIAEVAVLYPKAGGNYVFLREAYGRLGGFLWGWVEFVIIKSASVAALATVFTEQLQTVLKEIVGPQHASQLPDPWFWYGLTVAVIMALALVNVRGVRWGGLLQLLITLVKVGSLLAILVLPFVVAALVTSTVSPVQPGYLLPVLPESVSDSVVLVGKFGAALLAVLWAYHGWMNIAPVAEEIRQPQRNIPLALLGGVGIIILLYLGANLAYYLVIPQGAMAQMKDTATSGDTTVAIGFSRALLGSAGVAVAAAVVACSVFGALNGNLLVGPRVLYAMGEDRLAPRLLSEVHPRFRTPAVAILVMGLWASLLVVGVPLLRDFKVVAPERASFDVLTDFVMFGAVIFETLAVSSIFVFRRRLPKADRPYRCWGYPVVPAVYIGIMALVVCNTLLYRTFEATAALGFVAVGAIVYAIFLDRPGCLKDADDLSERRIPSPPP